jgi:hypothetical protein
MNHTYGNEIGGASDRAEMPQQVPQVALVSNTLAENCEILLKLMHDLEQRLAPLMRPEAHDEKAGMVHETPKRSAMAPHAEFLEMRNDTLRLVIQRLEVIHSRLEV